MDVWKHWPNVMTKTGKPGSANLKPRPRGSAGESSPAGFHPRNRHQGRYDFDRLTFACPDLARHVRLNAYGENSIDFADPDAVRALNAALLLDQYAIQNWSLPPDCLCPPVPGRADYLHQLADLLAADSGGRIPRGPDVRVLDIGVGANCIYPLLGHAEYAWTFVGTDINRQALDWAQGLLAANPTHAATVELRLQASRQAVFKGLISTAERFALSMCNPPFHPSVAAARAGSERKWRNLGKAQGNSGMPKLNFGGNLNELCCAGGEAAFIARMIDESVDFSGTCGWFTSLVSRVDNLPAINRALKQAGVHAQRIIGMAQGQKTSRIVAWSFLNAADRALLAASAENSAPGHPHGSHRYITAR
jgi:23S rRNA (adenine1618-N6)-methyltransferase